MLTLTQLRRLAHFDADLIEALADQLSHPDGRALRVGTDWPDTAPEGSYFTSIQDAIDAAEALSPTAAAPVAVYIAPGTYTEDLTLMSDVHLIGVPGQFMTRIDGIVTYTPGAGVNAAKTDTTEGVNLAFLYFTNGAKAFTFDGTGKNTSGAQMILTECTLTNFVSTNAHITSGSDNIFVYNGNWITGTYTFTNLATSPPGLDIVGTRVRGLTAAGTTVARLQGCGQVANGAASLTVSDTAQMHCHAMNLLNAVNVTSSAAIGFTAHGCKLTGTLTVTGASAVADIRGSNYGSAALLVTASGGCINRSIWNGTTSATAVGANPITFSVAYPSGETSYNVGLTLVSGAGNAAATVTAKTATGFTITDTVGTNVWDYTVFNEG
jgi:hypothetical protein